jgi:hypothetical protein
MGIERQINLASHPITGDPTQGIPWPDGNHRTFVAFAIGAY